MRSRTKKVWRKAGRRAGKRYGLMHKAVAVVATAFFIFSGTPVPTSFAGVNQPVANESGQFTPVLSLEQANARQTAVVDPVPSGSAVPVSSPLSASSSSFTSSYQISGSSFASTSFDSNNQSSTATMLVPPNATSQKTLTVSTSSGSDSLNLSPLPTTTEKLQGDGNPSSAAATLQTTSSQTVTTTVVSAVYFPSLTVFNSTQPPSSATLSQTSADRFSVNFDVSQNGSYVGSICSFDDFGTPGIETFDLNSVTELSFNLRLSSGSGTIKFELEDRNGNRGGFYITGVTTAEANRVITTEQVRQFLPQLDISKLKNINFVIESAKVTVKNTSLEVRFGRFPYVPVISTPTAAALTDFSAMRPFASKIEAVPGTTVVNFTQPSPDQFSFGYNLPAGGAQRWAAAQIGLSGAVPSFSIPPSGIVLGVTVTGASYYKLEVQDFFNHKVTLKVMVTNGRVAITEALLRSAEVEGFDPNRIQAIIVVVDDPQATIGQVTVDTKGLLYNPVISGSFYNPATISHLTGNPVVTGVANSAWPFSQGTISLTQTSSRDFNFTYSLPSLFDYAFAYLGNGYFDIQNSNTWVGTTMNLTGGATFAISGPDGKQLKVEVIDKNQKRAVYYLNLTGVKQNYHLDFASMDIDPTQVVQITFVAEQSRAGSSGTILVETRGLRYVPVISVPTPAPLTDFSARRPSVAKIDPSTGPTITNLTQASAEQFSFGYDLSAAGSQRWAAGQILFSEVFTLPPEGLVLDVNVTGASYYNLEVQDIWGHKVTAKVIVTNGKIAVTESLLLMAGVDGFDPSRISAIVVVVDDPAARTGTVTVNTKGLYYELAIAPDPVLTPADVTVLQGINGLTAIDSNPIYWGTRATLTQTSSSTYALHYDLSIPGGWALVLSAFDDFGSTWRETRDLSGLGSLVAGLRLEKGSGRVKFQVEDADGGRGIVWLNNVSTAEQFYRIPLDQLTGVDLTKVTNVNFVVERWGVSEMTGTLNVRLGGHPYTPVIAPDPALHPADLAGLPGNPQPTLVYAQGANATATLQQRGMSFTFDTGTVGWAGAGITFDDYNTPDYETADLSQLGSLIFELWGTVPGGKIKLEIVDSSEHRDWVYLTAITTQEGNVWKVQTADFEGVDLTHARMIYFIAEGLHQTGELFVNYKSPIPPVPSGWTRTATNQNFAFQERQINCQPLMVGCNSELVLMDLRTGKETQLSVWNPSSSGDVVVKDPDVSVDEQLVYYAFHSIRTLMDSVTVQRINDLQQKAEFSGKFQEVSFLPDGNVSVVMRLDFLNGTQISDVYTVNKDTLVSSLAYSRLLAQSDAVLKEGYLIVPEHNDYSNHFTVTLYDASQGTGHLVKIPHSFEYHASQSAGGSSGSGSYSLIDVYRTSQGRNVISVGMSANGNLGVDYGVTLLIDPKDGRTVQTVSLQGAASSVVYEGDYAIYTIGSLMQWVDLVQFARLAVPPPVATAMSKLTLLLGLDSDQKANIKLLKLEKKTWNDGCVGWNLSGVLCTQAFVDEYRVVLDLYGNEYEFHAGSLDPDKRAAIVAMSDMVAKGTGLPDIKINGVKKVTTGQGSLDWYFEVNLLAGSAKRFYWISPKYQILPPQVPQGWTRAAGNENYAFRITYHDSYFQTLELLDLNTSVVKVIKDIYAGPSTGNTFTQWVNVRTDGKYAVYETMGVSSGVKNVYISSISSPDQTVSVQIGRATVESVEYSGDKVLIRVGPYAIDGKVRGVYEVNLTTGGVIFYPELPSGWTRAASNANYAFRRVSMSLQLKDLVTGVETTVASGYTGGYPLYISDGYDVSPDGTTVIYSTTQVLYGNYTYLQRISDPSQKMKVNGNATAIRFEMNGQIAVLTIGGKEIRINVAMFQYSLPSGWTLAKSNSNFAFTMVSQRVGQYDQSTLKLQDLRTGQVQDIATYMLPYGGFTGVYDVSPDGATVIYAKTGPISPQPVSQTIYVQRTANAAQQLSFAGELASILFNADGTATLGARTTYPSGTVIESLRRVDLANLQVAPISEYRLVKEGMDIYKYANEKVLVQIEKTPWTWNNNRCRILVYDITNGTDRMRLVSDDLFGSGYPATANIKLTSITKVNGQRIVSVSLDASAGASDYRSQSTFVTNVDSGKKLVLNGWASSVTYQGTNAVFTLNLIHPEQFGEKQAVRQVQVDLTTLLPVPSLPAGWTRTTGNNNFAYRIVNMKPWYGFSATRRMEIMDLTTGAVRVVRTVASFFNRYGEVFVGGPVVSADGKTISINVKFLNTGKVRTEIYDAKTGKRIK